MPAYVIVDIEVRDPATYEEYKQLSGASLAAHDGRFIVRGGKVETLEGTWLPGRLVVLEFPSVAQAKAWWNSVEYETAKKIRQASAVTEMIVVEGLPD